MKGCAQSFSRITDIAKKNGQSKGKPFNSLTDVQLSIFNYTPLQ